MTPRYIPGQFKGIATAEKSVTGRLKRVYCTVSRIVQRDDAADPPVLAQLFDRVLCRLLQ